MPWTPHLCDTRMSDTKFEKKGKLFDRDQISCNVF